MFWELCYIKNYKDGGKNFASESNKIPVCRVVVFSKSIGHSVTYKVYNEATGALLFRSHLRKVDRGADINNRVMRVERVDKCLDYLLLLCGFYILFVQCRESISIFFAFAIRSGHLCAMCKVQAQAQVD